jgi:SAM-dependent methyltransferase
LEKSVKSKGWDWSQIPEEHWNQPSDEFLPVALRWKELGKKTVLDLGCGRGRHSLFLAGMGLNVTAVDISPEGIEQLQQEAKQRKLSGKIKTLVRDMLELPFPVNSFDAVLAFLSITHTDYAGLKKVIAKITHILKDSGRFYVTFNSKNSTGYRDSSNKIVDEYTIVKIGGLEDGIPHTYLEYKDIINLLADYKVLKIQQIEDYHNNYESFHFFVEAEKK